MQSVINRKEWLPTNPRNFQFRLTVLPDYGSDSTNLYLTHQWWQAATLSLHWSATRSFHSAQTSWCRCGTPASWTAEGERDHTNSAMTIATQPRCFPSLVFPPLRSADLKGHSHPSAVQCTRPFSFLSNEDHAASLLFLFALPHFDLSVSHCHHHLLDCVWTHAPAGTLKDPGCWRLGAKVPISRKEEDKKLVKGVKTTTCWPLERIHLWRMQALTQTQ